MWRIIKKGKQYPMDNSFKVLVFIAVVILAEAIILSLIKIFLKKPKTAPHKNTSDNSQQHV